jgi:hypothetical protein
MDSFILDCSGILVSKIKYETNISQYAEELF